MVTPECLVRWSMVVESNENSNPRFDQSKECNLNVMTFHYSHSFKANHDRPHHRFRIHLRNPLTFSIRNISSANEIG